MNACTSIPLNSQVGNTVITDYDGEFQGKIDPSLMLISNGPFTLKFKYHHNTADVSDRDFELILPNYIPGTQMEDILMPVKIMQQTRALINSMLNPDPATNDVKLVGFADTLSIHRKVYDLNAVQIKLDSLNANAIDILDVSYIKIYANFSPYCCYLSYAGRAICFVNNSYFNIAYNLCSNGNSCLQYVGA